MYVLRNTETRSRNYALHVSDALCVHHQEHYKL